MSGNVINLNQSSEYVAEQLETMAERARTEGWTGCVLVFEKSDGPLGIYPLGGMDHVTAYGALGIAQRRFEDTLIADSEEM